VILIPGTRGPIGIGAVVVDFVGSTFGGVLVFWPITPLIKSKIWTKIKQNLSECR
jgi:hypothetical protein